MRESEALRFPTPAETFSFVSNIEVIMKNKLIIKAAVALMFFGLIALTACQNNGTPSGGTTGTDTSAGTTAGITTAPSGKVSIHDIDPIELYLLDWSGSSIKRPDGTNCNWNWKYASNSHVTKLNVIFQCYNEDGTQVWGHPDTEALQAQLDRMQYELGESKKAGIGIIGFGDTVQFTEVIATKMGYTVDQLCAKTLKGDNISTSAWGFDAYIACINSPEWTEWQANNIAMIAKAGFAGFQFDFYPYSAAGYFCQCENCKKSWAAYSKEVLGVEKKLLVGKVNFNTEEGIAFFRWKLKCLADFEDACQEAAKAVNPDFEIVMNENANGYTFGLDWYNGMWDNRTSELHGVNSGYDSTLYMYQLTESLGYNTLRVQYNTDAQGQPRFRLKVNLAESFAICGGITMTTDEQGIGTKMFKFADKYRGFYSDTASQAKAAVLYSVESSLYSLSFGELDLGGQLFTSQTDITRRAASALLKSGVTYDYLAVEREGAVDRLAQYQLLVVPEYSYFEDSYWKPIIEKAIANGSKIIVVGEEAGEHIKTLTNDSNIVYLPDFIATADEASFDPGDAFRAAVSGTEAAELIVLENNLSNTAATLRTSDYDKYAFIHVVRRGGDDNSESLYQQLKYTLPEGKSVKQVTAYCPWKAGHEIKVEWSETDGVLSAKTGDFGTYTVIFVEFN